LDRVLNRDALESSARLSEAAIPYLNIQSGRLAQCYHIMATNHRVNNRDKEANVAFKSVIYLLYPHTTSNMLANAYVELAMAGDDIDYSVLKKALSIPTPKWDKVQTAHLKCLLAYSTLHPLSLARDAIALYESQSRLTERDAARYVACLTVFSRRLSYSRQSRAARVVAERGIKAIDKYAITGIETVCEMRYVRAITIYADIYATFTLYAASEYQMRSIHVAIDDFSFILHHEPERDRTVNALAMRSKLFHLIGHVNEAAADVRRVYQLDPLDAADRLDIHYIPL
jgi:hypothetical protein